MTYYPKTRSFEIDLVFILNRGNIEVLRAHYEMIGRENSDWSRIPDISLDLKG